MNTTHRFGPAVEDQDGTTRSPNENVSACGVKPGHSERCRATIIYHVSKTASGERENAPLVITLLLVIQLKPPRVPLPQVDHECLSGTQQHKQYLAETRSVSQTEILNPRRTDQFFG